MSMQRMTCVICLSLGLLVAVELQAGEPESCLCCDANSVGDIGGFWYDHQSYDDGVVMKCRLNAGTNPSDSLALYVADVRRCRLGVQGWPR
jgi:hypothetical protein